MICLMVAILLVFGFFCMAGKVTGDNVIVTGIIGIIAFLVVYAFVCMMTT